MAYQKEFAAESGLEVQTAYWRPTRFSLSCDQSSSLSLRFSGYISKEKRKEGKTPLAGAVHDYALVEGDPLLNTTASDLYDEASLKNATVVDIIWRWSYLISQQVKDTALPAPDPTKPATKTSFFQEAPQV